MQKLIPGQPLRTRNRLKYKRFIYKWCMIHRFIIIITRKLLTSLPPSSHWVLVYSNWFVILKRALEMSTISGIQWLNEFIKISLLVSLRFQMNLRHCKNSTWTNQATILLWNWISIYETSYRFLYQYGRINSDLVTWVTVILSHLIIFFCKTSFEQNGNRTREPTWRGRIIIGPRLGLLVPFWTIKKCEKLPFWLNSN